MNRGSTNTEGIIYQLKRIGAPSSLPEVPEVFKLKQDVTLIGRARGKVEFFIDSLKNKGLISRIHARIFRSKTQSGQDVFKICDTSLNGTYVNDIKILNEAPLIPGDTVAFGHLQGAALHAGKHYAQPDSEFQYKFERLSEAHSPNTSNESNTSEVENSEKDDPDCPSSDLEAPTCRHSNNPDLSVFLETPTPPSLLQSSNNGSKLCTTKRELVKKFNENENESDVDFTILQEYASAARLAAEIESDSDEDLFSVKYTSLLPGGTIEKWGGDECKISEKNIRKRKAYSKSSQRNCSFKKASLHVDCQGERCSARKCLKPNEKLISWVQCDDCDKWFHVKCAGLSLKLVKPKNAKFHCGCS